MSRTASIFCIDCKKSAWISQTHGGPVYHLYHGEYLALLQTFLNEHKGHSLIFEDDEEMDIDEFEHDYGPD